MRLRLKILFEIETLPIPEENWKNLLEGRGWHPAPLGYRRVKLVYMDLLLCSKNPYIITLKFEGRPAVGSHLMITNSNIRLLGS